MKSTKLVSSAVFLLLLPQFGCGKVLGIEEKRLTFAASPPTKDCALIAESGTALRVMNAIPGSPVLDLCEKGAGAARFGQPWFASNASACGEGVAYTQFTRNLRIKEGTHDFKLVPAGQSCDAEGIEAAQIAIGADSSLTLMAYGPSLATGQISVLANRVTPGDAQPLRFVHALNNAGVLSAGMRMQDGLVKFLLFNSVEFGGIAPKTEVPTGLFNDVDELGYVTLGGATVPEYPLDLAVQQAADNQILVSAPMTLIRGHAYTVFALGNHGQTTHRPKIWSCDESAYSGVFLSCGNPDRIAIEVFDPNITDAFTTLVQERTQPVIDALTAGDKDSDILCVTELYDRRIIDQLRNPNSGGFNGRLFSIDIPPDRVTALTKKADGSDPSYPELACPADLAVGLKDWFTCIMNTPGCSIEDPSVPGTHLLAKSGLEGLACMMACDVSAPTQMVYDIQSGSRAESGSCYWCAISHFEGYESFESTLEKCTKPVPAAERQHLAFGGSTGLAVFSRKHTLGNPELVLLPSSGWQRAAMRVPVTAENGAVFDYWCTSIRYPNTEALLSYAGPYGTWGMSGSGEEQAYQIANAVAFIEQRAKESGRPAIVGVVAHAGPEVVDPVTGEVLVYPLAAESFAQMGDRWPELVAPEYTPACTFCGDPASNPLNSFDVTKRYWTTHLLGLGVSPSDVESTVRTFTDRTFGFKDSQGTLTVGPVSQHYGLRSVVRITQ